MKRLSAHSAWLAVGVLLALGVWLYFDLKQPVREPGENPKISDLVGIKADQVRRIEITRDGAVLALAKTGAAWAIEQPIKAAADAETVKSALEGMLDQSSDYVMEKPPKDLTQYGLAKPTKTIALIGSGKRVVLQIGGKDPGKSSVFTRVADGGKVFLAGSYAVEALADKQTDEFRDKAVLTIAREGIEHVRITRKSGVVALARTGGKWALTEPMSAPADEFNADGIVDALASLKADRFVVAGATDLKTYSLDAPLLTVEIRARGGAQYGLKVGKEVPGGTSVYASRASDNDVVEIAKATYDTLNKTLGDLRSKKLLDVPTDQVERVAVTTPKTRWEVGKSGSDWLFVAPNAGKKADAIDVDNAILDATGSADRWVADNPSEADLGKYGLVQPGIVVTFTLKGGAVKKLELGKKEASGDRYARGTDTGASVFAIGSYVADRLKTAPKEAK
ncbi:MAG: DUF4340 domain-containing protein [Armatimonadetes bacterium]|nr:DUF4340 domain-containing protein [Armatimonadota bacterium]